MPNLKSFTILEYQDNGARSDDIKKQYLRIHKHYLFIFQQLFEVYHHSHVFCVEDDLTLSSTALQFIQQLVNLLDSDPSLICLSLFNDNASLFLQFLSFLGLLKILIRLFFIDLLSSPILLSSSTVMVMIKSGKESKSLTPQTVGIIGYVQKQWNVATSVFILLFLVLFTIYMMLVLQPTVRRIIE